MRANDFLSIYKADSLVQTLSEGIRTFKPIAHRIKGLTGSLDTVIFATTFKASHSSHIVILQDKEEAAFFLNDLQNLLGDKNLLLFPMSYKRPYDYDEIENANILMRAETLNQLASHPDSQVIITYPEALSEKARLALNHLGVEVRTNSPVEKVDEDGVEIAGKRLATRNVIWTAGVAASPAGTWLKAEVDRAGRVKVQSDLSLPDYPNVFVIGDTASVMQDGKPLPGIAPVAMQEAHYVASLIEQRRAGTTETQPFHYRNKGNLATIGRSYGIADFGWLHFGGFVGWVLWLAVHIFFLIGFRNRVIVFFQWAWAYLTFQRGARLITFDSSSAVKDKELFKELV